MESESLCPAQWNIMEKHSSGRVRQCAEGWASRPMADTRYWALGDKGLSFSTTFSKYLKTTFPASALVTRLSFTRIITCHSVYAEATPHRTSYIRGRQEEPLAFSPRLCHHLPSTSHSRHCWLQTHLQRWEELCLNRWFGGISVVTPPEAVSFFFK